MASTVTRLTGGGVAALATVRVDGDDAAALVDRYFLANSGQRLRDVETGTIAVGRWGSATGEEIVVGKPTGEAIEIHCHGGAMAAEAIVAALVEAGARRLSWDQWIAQHACDAISAEAQLALAEATTEQCAQILLDQYHGALRSEIEQIRDSIAAGDNATAQQRLRALAQTAAAGLHLVAPFRVVLVGAANAGKSSLLNCLLGYQRAIVFDQPGTTRDVLSATTALGGWPFTFSDTAGIRTTDEAIEHAGIELARQAAEQADLVLLCTAKDQPPLALPAPFEASGRSVRVGTKADRPGDWPQPVDIETSAIQQRGIDELLQRIERTLVRKNFTAGEAVVFTARQARYVELALSLLQRGVSEQAVRELEAICGSAASAELA